MRSSTSEQEFISFEGNTVKSAPFDRVGLRTTALPFKFINILFEEVEWRRTLKDYSLPELLNIFPEAEKKIKKLMQEEIKRCEVDLRRAEALQFEFDKIIAWSKHQEFWHTICDVIWIQPLIANKIKTIKRYAYYLQPKTLDSSNGVTAQDIAQAKEVPITELIEVKRQKAKCLWHDDTNPSLSIKKNRGYCFVCNKGFDTIDIVMKQHNLDFIKAVKFLVKK